MPLSLVLFIISLFSLLKWQFLKVSLQVECLLSLKWLSRLARRKTNSKMDQICQVCLIPYLLHTAGTQFCPSSYKQQAGIRTMCLWSQLQFLQDNRYICVLYNIYIIQCLGIILGSVDLGVLCGGFVDGRIYHSSLRRKEQIIPVVFAVTLPRLIICSRQLCYSSAGYESCFTKRLCIHLNLECSVHTCVSHLVLISAADIHDFS